MLFRSDASHCVGYYTGYDPTTGIASIVGNRREGGTTTHTSAHSGTGTGINDIYFDLLVEDDV